MKKAEDIFCLQGSQLPIGLKGTRHIFSQTWEPLPLTVDSYTCATLRQGYPFIDNESVFPQRQTG